jgi:hypothetical protein
MRNAGIGLPAKGRAPAPVAGWAPRISQNRASVPDYLITNANATASPMPDEAPVIHTRRSLSRSVLFSSGQIQSGAEKELHKFPESSDLDTLVIAVNALEIFQAQNSSDVISLHTLGAKLR